MELVVVNGVAGSDRRLSVGECGDGKAIHGNAVRLHARSSELEAEIFIVNAHADGRSSRAAMLLSLNEEDFHVENWL